MLTHAEFLGRDAFTHPELLAFAYGRLIKDPPKGFRARLPLPRHVRCMRSHFSRSAHYVLTSALPVCSLCAHCVLTICARYVLTACSLCAAGTTATSRRWRAPRGLDPATSGL